MRYLKRHIQFLNEEFIPDAEGAEKVDEPLDVEGTGRLTQQEIKEFEEGDLGEFTFDSKIQLGKKLKEYPVNVIKNEPMLFNCTWQFAYDNGGDPTKEFLLALPEHLHNDKTIVDSRVHMLMQNWYPCIPGYHHDDVPREKSDQPDYHTPSYRSKHALVLYNGGICPTEFALGKAKFPEVPKGEIYYKIWHPMVLEKIKNGELELLKAPSEQVVFFNDRSWHQGTNAVGNGWRLFIRASWDTHRVPSNEIRRQVQVYMTNPNEGW